jgi:transcription initiation factor IIE alpha subunit
MSLTSQRIHIKKLNDRLLTQNVVMQTLIDIIIDSGIITEDELESRLEKNIESTQRILDGFEETSSTEEEVMSGMYYGPQGEA